jgi:transposase
MRPLSQDLRVRFCRAIDRGMSAREAARMLEVSAATGVRWAQAWQQRGSTLPGKVGGHMRPLLEGERDWLLARIEQKKDLIPNCTKTDSDLGFPNGKKSDSMASLAWRARYGSID